MKLKKSRERGSQETSRGATANRFDEERAEVTWLRPHRSRAEKDARRFLEGNPNHPSIGLEPIPLHHRVDRWHQLNGPPDQAGRHDGFDLSAAQAGAFPAADDALERL